MTSGSRIHIQWTHTFFVWPSLLAAALSCALIGLALQRSSPVGQAPSQGLMHAAVISGSVPPAASAPMSSALQGPLSRAVGAGDRDYAISAARDGFHAETAGGRIRASLSRTGVTVRSGSTWLKLSPRAIGTEASSRRFATVTPSAKGNRVDYVRAGVDEWYVNGPLGLEQGFTVSRAAASDAGRHLTLSLAISGDVRPSLSADRTAIQLAHRGGPSLRYGGLSARDSSGRTLASRLALHGATVTIEVDTSGAGYPVTIDPLIGQEDERPLPIGESEEGRFGFSIALSADGATALVGAPADNGFAGAAWVFTRVGSTWTQQGPKLTVNEATDAEEGERCAADVNECGFGRSVALSGDGDTALIGAPRANEAQGAAWVFVRSGSTWSQFGAKLTGSDEAAGRGSFGRSVALSGDGSTALVGAPRDSGGRGAAWAFTRSASGFLRQGSRLTGADELGAGFFGRSVALSSDGSAGLIGGPGDDHYAGAAWALARVGGELATQGSKLTGGSEEVGKGRFGNSVALSADATTGLVGARSDAEGLGAAWALVRNGSSWSQQGPKLTPTGELGEGQFGYATSLSADGSTALIGAPHDDGPVGAAWTFTRSGGRWTEQAELRPGGEESRGAAFGMGLALSADASTALIGAPHEARKLGGAWAYLGPPSSINPPPPPTEETPPASGETPSAGEAGNQVTPSSAQGGVLASTTSALPPPTLALTGNVVRLSGIVRVKLPGSRTFTLLSGGEQIPFGSIVDATHGRVSVTTAAPHGGTQTMVFYQGEFKLTQRRDGLVTSTLWGGSFSGCPTLRANGRRARSSAAHGKRPVRKLWAEGHGSYSTKGNYATGAVLGTRWLTEDLCAGTLIRVLTDRVAVTNLVTHKHVTVEAGHSYLAKAPRRRGH
jgi:hypothetical protein